ncbi:hypothetical protein DTL42_17230 [Bremerella cremea]|uniref:Uncharacterized protein n=1 Tax=Bremerella cremea TaxID=1031537 RepID=A0A368KN73_9BACT|nr:hypothetical protein DTL42_17230 [Bremerella cremea]
MVSLVDIVHDSPAQRGDAAKCSAVDALISDFREEAFYLIELVPFGASRCTKTCQLTIGWLLRGKADRWRAVALPRGDYG